MQLMLLKKDMRFNGELLSLIDTLKNIASSRYHALEREKERFERFMNAFSGFFRVIDLVTVDDPLVRAVTDVLGIVMVTSDLGFMGGLNQGIIRAAFAAQGDLPDAKVKLIVIGEKGAGKLQDMRREYKFFRGIEQETRYEQALEITDYLVGEVLERRIGKLVLIYPKPISFSQQTIETVNVLPCAELFSRGAESEAAERAGQRKFLAEARKVIVESSFAAIVEYLARTWVTSRLYEVFEDSKLAEYSARAMHLEGSHQKLEKEQKKLHFQYFRAAHENIDKGMRESFSATNIMRKRKAGSKAARAAKAEDAANAA